MADLPADEVGALLKRLGTYRVRRVQIVAGAGEPDGISAGLLLALGLRETGLRNVEGGAKRNPSFDDAERERHPWVALDPNLPGDPERMDVGWLQINRGFHRAALKHLPAVHSSTWSPVVNGKTPVDAGFVPRFEDALKFTLTAMHEAQAFGQDNGVHDVHLARFAVAAHNAGTGGALKGYGEGNVDLYTAGGDYSAWVLRHRSLVTTWLHDHPNWRA